MRAKCSKTSFVRPSPVSLYLISLLKYFCACDRVCALVLVPTYLCTLFQFLPHFLRASMNLSCSSSVHRPFYLAQFRESSSSQLDSFESVFLASPSQAGAVVVVSNESIFFYYLSSWDYLSRRYVPLL